MAISNNNGVLTLQDDGPYSWSDVVQAAATDISFINGLYQVDIEIQVIDCTLDIISKNILFLKPITTTDIGAGVINFGELVIEETKSYGKNGGHIFFNIPSQFVAGFATNVLSATRTESRFNLYGTCVSCTPNGQNAIAAISAAYDSVISLTLDTDTYSFSLFSQTSASIVNCKFVAIDSVFFRGNILTFESNVFIDCANNFRLFASDLSIAIRECQTQNASDFDYRIAGPSENCIVRFIDSGFDLSRARINRDGHSRYKSVSINLKAQDENGPVADARITVKSNAATVSANTEFNNQTDGNGLIPRIVADIQSSFGTDPLIINDHADYQISAYSYDHLPHTEGRLLTGPIGHGSDSPEVIVLGLDSSISLSKAQSLALTSINSPQDAYHRYKAEQAENASPLPKITRTGSMLYSEAPIMIDPNASTAFSYNGGVYTFRSNRFIGGISADVSLMNGASIEGGDYGTVVLENGFNGTATFNNVTIGNLVNNTGEDMITNVLTTSALPMPCLEVQ